jgi:transposase
MKTSSVCSRVTVRRSQRDRHSNWVFGDLLGFVTYEAKGQTSQDLDKKNRKKNRIECLKCGYKDMADYMAVVNIAVVKQPIVADLISSYKLVAVDT